MTRQIIALMILLSASISAAESGRWVEAILTAYSPLDAFTRDDVRNPHRLTATGVRTGRVPYGIAADPRLVPYGARIYIPHGIGYLDRIRPTAADRVFVCDDTGSIIRRESQRTGVIHLDLRYIGVEEALRFGRKRAWVYIMDGAERE